MTSKDDFFSRVHSSINSLTPAIVRGKVEKVESLLITAHLPQVQIGELVTLGNKGENNLKAEVVGFRGEKVVLAPLGSTKGISTNWEVTATGTTPSVKVSSSLVGRILDGLGNPIDGKPLPDDVISIPLDNDPPHPLRRKRIDTPLITGIRALDGLLTIGCGQRIGLFSGSGVGKSTLMGILAKRSSADINVVCLVGERGREVREFIEDSLGEEGMSRSIVVVSTSDNPSMVREKAPQTATAIAEFFREQEKNVLLFIDSLTRYARAKREISLSLGELPARRGYPPSIFAAIPRLLERAGNSEKGTITAIYTVLVEGGDMDEPIADEVRGIVDGHLILSREIAIRGRYPALDVPASVSRVMPAVVSENQLTLAAKVKAIIGALQQNRDLIRVGAYEKGADHLVDLGLKNQQLLEKFLHQGKESTNFETTLSMMKELIQP
jgi:FliI/YscN family ATPase